MEGRGPAAAASHAARAGTHDCGGHRAMSIRTYRIIFWIMVAAVVGMSVRLFAHREERRTRIEPLADPTPLDAPYTDEEPVTLLLANDDDGTIAAETRQIALPAETTARARALLDHLVTE